MATRKSGSNPTHHQLRGGNPIQTTGGFPCAFGSCFLPRGCFFPPGFPAKSYNSFFFGGEQIFISPDFGMFFFGKDFVGDKFGRKTPKYGKQMAGSI